MSDEKLEQRAFEFIRRQNGPPISTGTLIVEFARAELLRAAKDLAVRADEMCTTLGNTEQAYRNAASMLRRQAE
jgi:hypothetical protein